MYTCTYIYIYICIICTNYSNTYNTTPYHIVHGSDTTYVTTIKPDVLLDPGSASRSSICAAHLRESLSTGYGLFFFCGDLREQTGGIGFPRMPAGVSRM